MPSWALAVVRLAVAVLLHVDAVLILGSKALQNQLDIDIMD